MTTIFKGETKKFELTIKDAVGNTIAPSSLLNIKVFIYEQIRGSIIAQFSLLEEAGFSDLLTDDNKVRFILSKGQTQAASTGANIIQVNLYIYDEAFENDTRISVQKGLFTTIKEAKV